VRRALARTFHPVYADGDAHPDLAERFREYRWPATAFLTSDARPILALRGYRSPDEFLSVLEDVEERVGRGGPYAGFDAPGPASLPREEADRPALESLRRRLLAQLDAWWDAERAGWGKKQKYPIPEPVEHHLRFGPRERALATLAAEEALIDPVWGGMYQYGEGGVWTRPHFEKIAAVNAGAISNFADAFARTRDRRWRRDAERVVAWLRGFLRAPTGAFYASQDADGPGGTPGERYFALDDPGRRRLGPPRVDRRVGLLENGLFVEALCRLHAATDDPDVLSGALAAAEAVLAVPQAPDRPVYLAGQAAMGRACLALSQETGEERWLRRAREIGAVVRARLVDPEHGGFLDRTPDPGSSGVFAEPVRSLEPNGLAARFFLALGVLEPEGAWRPEALAAIAAQGEPSNVERHGRWVGGLLLAVEEALVPWARIEVVGNEGSATDALFREARRLARERPMVLVLRRGGSTHTAGGPFALVCGEGFCSDPVTTPADLARTVTRVLAPR
jgi:uncharacterized protein YyaL (SSP411 family)